MRESDISCWPGFTALLQDLPSPCSDVPLELGDVQAWLHVLRNLDVRKSTGVSGWSNAELRALPQAAVADLAMAVSTSEADAFPEHMMQARVCLLSKVEDPDLPGQARPITILCNVYRVWFRVVVSQVIRVWSCSLPRSIMGCLKGRSSSDLAYAISAQIEKALAGGTDLSGVSVDLTKAFNFLARAPLASLLCWLGMPRSVSQFWLRCLSKVSRCFQVGRSLSTAVGSTSGAPEGDPSSVLAMIAVSTAVAAMLPMVTASFYVDNWSWLSDRPGSHEEAFLALRAFTDSLRLVVDWKKSYTWSVHPASRKWLKQLLPRCVPAGVALPILSHVRELGVQIQFGRKICLQHVSPKLDEAARRLHVLFHEPLPLPAKAKVIQSGILPHAFFGSFNAAPGQHRIHRLRSLAARALVGRHHTMSAFAALYMTKRVMDPALYLFWSHARPLYLCLWPRHCT